MNYDQKSYVFVPTYGDESTGFHRHMISVVVFFYSNTLQSMLVDYAVTDMGCFGYYSYAASHAKIIRGDSITIFLLHVAQSIHFNKKIYTATLIAKALLNSLYSSLGFKMIKYFATSPNFEEDCK